jgi:tetratricopeptide (TPR) repeat protein
MGDGILASFQLASDSVRCALDLQSEARQDNIPLKIGINQGEILYEGNDVFGDGVNIAARLQEYVKEGCIAISGTIYQDIKNKKDVRTRYIGEVSLKNVSDPVKIYLVSCVRRLDKEQVAGKTEQAEIQRRRIFQPSFLKISFITTPLLVLITFFLFYGGTSLPFKERDWILIADFENQTGEPVFDRSLTAAFMISINQSRHINVLSRQRMQDALERMKKEDTDFINEKTGREIALREGLKICIVPGISRVGNQYMLMATIQEAETADILRSEIVYAENRDDIIRKLDRLSRKIRHDLGESRFNILQQGKSLPKVTTGSLDALKEYALGIDKHKKLYFDEAVMHYQEAIRLDSTFTAAKASLGNLLVERYDPQEGKKWLEQAIASIDDLTEREKYGVLSFYAVNVEKDLERGIEYTKTRITLYPDDPVPHNNLAWYYQNAGRFEKAVDEYKAALRIDPFMSLANGGLNWVYLEHLGQMDSLLFWSNNMIDNSPDNPWGYFYLGSCLTGIGKLKMAESEFLKAMKLDEDFLFCAYRLAHVYRLQGMYGEAIKILQEIYRKNPGETTALFDLGVNYQLMGNEDAARSHFLEYKKTAEKWRETYPDDPKSYYYFGILLTHLGERDSGWEIGRQGYEMDSTTHFVYSQLLAVQGKKQEALDQLRKALENGYRDVVWLKLHPDLQTLQNEPLFLDLIKRYFNL